MGFNYVTFVDTLNRMDNSIFCENTLFCLNSIYKNLGKKKENAYKCRYWLDVIDHYINTLIEYIKNYSPFKIQQSITITRPWSLDIEVSDNNMAKDAIKTLHFEYVIMELVCCSIDDSYDQSLGVRALLIRLKNLESVNPYRDMIKVMPKEVIEKIHEDSEGYVQKINSNLGYSYSDVTNLLDLLSHIKPSLSPYQSKTLSDIRLYVTNIIFDNHKIDKKFLNDIYVSLREDLIFDKLDINSSESADNEAIKHAVACKLREILLIFLRDFSFVLRDLCNFATEYGRNGQYGIESIDTFKKLVYLIDTANYYIINLIFIKFIYSNVLHITIYESDLLLKTDNEISDIVYTLSKKAGISVYIERAYFNIFIDNLSDDELDETIKNLYRKTHEDDVDSFYHNDYNNMKISNLWHKKG